MQAQISAFLIAVLAVTLAEMGDKTQLLAMAFACRFRASKVMLGVFIATVLNHGLAVALGNLVTRVPVLDVWISAIAAISFIFFGLWTIRGDRLEGEEKRENKYGAVMTVLIAFFIAELGDKTQLATIALAAKYPDAPFGILAGTTTGMLIADAIGIVIGVVMCKKIPERTIKLVSAGAFIIFGFIACWQAATDKIGLSVGTTAVLLGVLLAVTLGIGWWLVRTSKTSENEVVDEFCAVRRLEDEAPAAKSAGR